MKIYNAEKTKQLETYDLSHGHLEPDVLHVLAVEGVEEQGQFRNYPDFPNRNLTGLKGWCKIF